MAAAVHHTGGKTIFIGKTKLPASIWRGVFDYEINEDIDRTIEAIHHQ